MLNFILIIVGLILTIMILLIFDEKLHENDMYINELERQNKMLKEQLEVLERMLD